MSETTAWRPVFAALANEGTRRLWAELVLGVPASDAGSALSPSRRRHALESLRKAGLIDGDHAPRGDAFTTVLASAPRPPRATGVERFLTAEGRIDRYPANLGEREELLRHVVEQVLAPDEVVDEAGLNERLSRFSDDTAVLRRYLVDFGVLERTTSGSQYARVLTP